MRMNKMRRLFYVLIAFAMMATLVPSTEVSAADTGTIAEGEYDVTVGLYNATAPENLSMSADVLKSDAKLKVENGEWYLYLTFQETVIMSYPAVTDKVSYFENKDASSDVANAKDTEVISTFIPSFTSEAKPEVVKLKVPEKNQTDIYVSLDTSGRTSTAIVRVNYGDLIETNKTTLTSLVTTANGYDKANYTSASFSALQTAITNANTVLANADATQAEVNEQTTLLQEAINGLVGITSTEGATLVKRQEVDVVQLSSSSVASTEEDAWVEYTGVVETYSNGVTLMTLQTKTAGKSGLTAYLKSFKIMNADGVYLEALYGDLDEEGFPTSVTFPIEIKEETVVEELLMAYMPVPTPSYFLTMFPDGHEVGQKLQIEWDSAVTVLDFTELNALISSAKAYDSSEYTEESFTALATAITAAETVSANANSTQAEIDAQVVALQEAIDGLVVVEADVLADGVYEVPVDLWHASEDKASMAASALLPTSRIVVSDGEATMYIYTQEMQFGTITASLQELKIVSLARSYTNAVVETKDADGNPISFSFVLPHMNEYLDVLVNPQVALMGNQDIAARLKIDYTAMEKVSDDTDLSIAPGTANNNTGNTSNTTTPAATNQSASVAAGDTTNSALLLAMLVMAGMAGMYVTARTKKQ